MGEGIRYDTCRRRGIVDDALTNFTEGSTVWFLRGNVAQDSSSSRIYAGSSEITSCDLPTPHYHFSAKQMKWVSKNVLIARPVVLYVRDVPILWLPFIFQDVRPGRRSGILVPQFGLNDLVRPTRGYNRQITNIGYYWAPNDYLDLTARLDWFANRYVQYGVDRPVPLAQPVRERLGGVQRAAAGGRRIGADLPVGPPAAVQSLDQPQRSTSTTPATRAVIRGNAIDPLQNTQQITSSLNYSKRLSWATLTLGGNRRQSLTDGSVQQLLPAVTLSPVPDRDRVRYHLVAGAQLHQQHHQEPVGRHAGPRAARRPVSTRCALDATQRVTALSFDTPLRIGGFNWQNSVQVNDRQDRGDSSQLQVDDPSTPDPTDSVSVRRTFLSNFESTIDWDTGINLPVLFRGSWKVQPVGRHGQHDERSRSPFATGTRTASFVRQGKRFRFGATASPTLFAFFPGIGPLEPHPPQLLARHRVELPAGGQRAGGVSRGRSPSRARPSRFGAMRSSRSRSASRRSSRGSTGPGTATPPRPKARRRGRSGSSASTPAG